MSEELKKAGLGDVLGKGECYLANFAELAADLKEVAVEQDGSVIKIEGPQEVVAIVQVLWDKFKETALECEGKTIEVKLPGSWTGMILAAALNAIGFKL